MTTIALQAKVCPLGHGGPHNAALAYGHHGMTRTCLRVGMSDTWVYDIKKAK